jgi:hypothetical protein
MKGLAMKGSVAPKSKRNYKMLRQGTRCLGDFSVRDFRRAVDAAAVGGAITQGQAELSSLYELHLKLELNSINASGTMYARAVAETTTTNHVEARKRLVRDALRAAIGRLNKLDQTDQFRLV